jgi:hypothetical protein
MRTTTSSWVKPGQRSCLACPDEIARICWSSERSESPGGGNLVPLALKLSLRYHVNMSASVERPLRVDVSSVYVDPEVTWISGALTGKKRIAPPNTARDERRRDEMRAEERGKEREKRCDRLVSILRGRFLVTRFPLLRVLSWLMGERVRVRVGGVCRDVQQREGSKALESPCRRGGGSQV